MLKLKMKIKYFFILGLILVFYVPIFLFYNVEKLNNVNEFNNIKISQVCVKDNCFDVEVADTLEKREIGLMNREYLAPDSGMLFIFENEGVYNFWMKNTLILLDIIWIDKNNEIIYIEKNAEPCMVEQCETFGPNKEALYILEINGGMTEKMGLRIGNEVEYK